MTFDEWWAAYGTTESRAERIIAEKAWNAARADVSRDAVLNEAAKVCAKVALNSNPDDFALDAANECEHSILALKRSDNSTRQPEGK